LGIKTPSVLVGAALRDFLPSTYEGHYAFGVVGVMLADFLMQTPRFAEGIDSKRDLSRAIRAPVVTGGTGSQGRFEHVIA
jgi:hypothetical protein